MSADRSSACTEVKAESRSLDRPAECRLVAMGVGVDMDPEDLGPVGMAGAGVST
jgi:hypothetical protein